MTSRFLACAALTALSAFLGLCEKCGRESSAPAASAAQCARHRVSATRAGAKLFAQPECFDTPSRLPDAATRARIQDLLNRIQDAYFDYNKHSCVRSRSRSETRRSDAG